MTFEEANERFDAYARESFHFNNQPSICPMCEHNLICKMRMNADDVELAISACAHYSGDATTESITWHPYPKEKPNEGTYLVTCKDFDGDTDLCFGDFKYGVWLHCPYLDDQVIAWAELPRPYRG